MLGLELFVSRTQYGRAMRAVSVDKDMSELMGIDVNRVIAVTFFLGSALAAAAGTMAGAYYGSIWYFMGFLIGLKAFTAAVIGGIGSIPGAMLGGLILGLLESFGTQIPGIGSEWKDVFSFSVLILVLVFKPTGPARQIRTGAHVMARPCPQSTRRAPGAASPRFLDTPAKRGAAIVVILAADGRRAAGARPLRHGDPHQRAALCRSSRSG